MFINGRMTYPHILGFKTELDLDQIVKYGLGMMHLLKKLNDGSMDSTSVY